MSVKNLLIDHPIDFSFVYLEKGILHSKENDLLHLSIVCSSNEKDCDDFFRSPTILIFWNDKDIKISKWTAYFVLKNIKVKLDTITDSQGNSFISLGKIHPSMEHAFVLPYAKFCYTKFKPPLFSNFFNHTIIMLPLLAISKSDFFFDGPIICYQNKKISSFVFIGGCLRHKLSTTVKTIFKNQEENFIQVISKYNCDFIKTSIVHASLYKEQSGVLYIENISFDLETALSFYLIRQIFMKEKIVVIEKKHQHDLNNQQDLHKWKIYYQLLGYFYEKNIENKKRILSNKIINLLKNFPIKNKLDLLNHLNSKSKTFDSIKDLIL